MLSLITFSCGKCAENHPVSVWSAPIRVAVIKVTRKCEERAAPESKRAGAVAEQRKSQPAGWLLVMRERLLLQGSGVSRDGLALVRGQAGDALGVRGLLACRAIGQEIGNLGLGHRGLLERGSHLAFAGGAVAHGALRLVEGCAIFCKAQGRQHC